MASWLLRCPALCLIAVVLCVVAAPAEASTWNICDLRVKVLGHHRTTHEIEVQVLDVASKRGIECPSKGMSMRFAPETADYQAMLPRKQWPRTGGEIRMRYQYLDGICKERGPCRIVHYPVLR